jgi:hypothetical protein
MFSSFKNGGLLAILMPVERDERDLVEQFFVTLETGYAGLRSAPGDEQQRELQEIEQALKGERNWRNAYRIEQAMVSLMRGSLLDIELKRRLLEARNYLRPEYCAFYESEAKDADEARKSSLLVRLVNDLQWQYEVFQAHQSYGTRYRVRCGLLFSFSFLLFFLPYIAPWLANLINATPGTVGYYVYTALSAGAVGAAFSILMGMKPRIEESSLDNLRVISRYSNLITRIIIGMGAGMIFYYLLKSGLLEGSMTPHFDYQNDSDGCGTTTVLDEKGRALMIIWCFIAGFSEKLVPHVLDRAAQQMQHPEQGKKPK